MKGDFSMSQLINISTEDIPDIDEIMNFKQFFIESLKEHKISKATAKDCRTAFVEAIIKWHQSIEDQQQSKDEAKQKLKSVMKGCAK